MKLKPKIKNNKSLVISKQKQKLKYNEFKKGSKSINLSSILKEKNEINNNQKYKFNQIKLLYNNKNNKGLTIIERKGSAKPIKIRNKFNQKLYDKIEGFTIEEKNKKRANSTISIQKNNNKEIINPKIIKSIHIIEKDILELGNNEINSLHSFINIFHINGKIELEIINIIKNSNNIKDKKNIYANLLELFNNIFDQFDFFIKNEINFFIRNELNKLTQKSLELLLIFHSILFINIALLSINDSITIINTQYENSFKKIFKIIYNLFDKYIYADLKNKNLFENNLSDFNNFIENELNELIEKNKYKIIINSKNKNIEQMISYLNKLIDLSFSDLKEITETMRFSTIPPAANSLRLLINSLNKKNLSSCIDIMSNVILYSLLNKNIKIAYNNMLKDKNNDINVFYSRNSVPYLPKISKDKTYTLILDLDETLIHYFYSKVETRGAPQYGYFSSDESYGVFNNYLLEDTSENEKIDKYNFEFIRIGMFLLRPYAKQFLQELNKYYEISIFTTGTKEYCDRVLQLLDLDNNLIKYRLYKHHIALKDIKISVKDLSLLGRDLNKTIIIDNLEENFRLQPDNGLPIITWKGDINDYSLKYLTAILKNIVINKVPDVRKIIKKIKSKIKSGKNPSYSKVNPNSFF